MNAMLPRRDDVLELLHRRRRALTAREMASQLAVAESSLPGFTRFVDSLAQEGALRWVDPDRYTVEAPSGRSTPPRHTDAPPTAVRLLGGTLHRRRVSSWIAADDEDLTRPVVMRGEASGTDGDAAVARLDRAPEFPDENPEGTLLGAFGPAGTRAPEEAKILRLAGFDPGSPEGSPLRLADGASEPRAEGEPGAPGAAQVPGGWGLVAGPDDTSESTWDVRRDADGFTVTIALAAVSRLVAPGSALDRAASDQGRALELPSGRRPLWPAGVMAQAGLEPGEARGCLGLTARVGADGSLREARFVSGVTIARGRLDESDVEAALGEASEGATAGEVSAAVSTVLALADARRARRRLGEAVLVGGDRARVKLRRGEPRTVERAEETRAERIANELEGLVDEAVARWLLERGLVGVFRARGVSDRAQLARFAALAPEVSVGEGPEASLAGELTRLAEHPRGRALREVLRRALGPTRYTLEATDAGPLPPSAPASSPLRRHVDVEVQRVILAALAAEGPGGAGERWRQGDDDEARLGAIAHEATAAEVRAAWVEAETLALHRALVMTSHVGETLEGIVVDVTPGGVVVALDEPFAEVIVPADALGADHYASDPDRLRFFAERTGESVGMGDPIWAVIATVDVGRHRVTGRRPAANASEPEEAVRVPAARPSRRGASWRESKVAGRHATGKPRGR